MKQLAITITVATWVSIIQIVMGILGLLAPFLQKGDFTVPAIIVLVMGILQLILTRLVNTQTVRLGMKK